jgi:hypothetical protein
MGFPKIYELMTVLAIFFFCRSCTTLFSYPPKLCLSTALSICSTSSSTAQRYSDQGAMLDIDDVNFGDNGFWKLHSTHVTELSHASHLDFCIPRSQRPFLRYGRHARGGKSSFWFVSHCHRKHVSKIAVELPTSKLFSKSCKKTGKQGRAQQEILRESYVVDTASLLSFLFLHYLYPIHLDSHSDNDSTNRFRRALSQIPQRQQNTLYFSHGRNRRL